MIQAVTLHPVRLWRDHPRETILFGGFAFAAAVAIAGAAWSTPTVSGLPGRAPAAAAERPPAPPPLLVRELAVEDALAVNRGIPLASGPNPAAKPFLLGSAGEAARARALECLTSAVYYEAGNESADGQRAVAQVVLNRVRHPAFPTSVCGVVYQGSTRSTGCQFTFTCDGSLLRAPSAAGWQRARKIAEGALAGAVYKPVGTATHYHANYVVPYWAASLAKNAVVGAHIFYRWAGGWGRPAAFDQRYAGREPDSQALRTAAAEAEQRQEADGALAEIPGAEPLPESGKKGDGRVGVRFNLAAREAVEEAPKVPYLEKVEASDNLRWSLTGDIVEAQQEPLGRPAPTTGGGASAGSPN